MCSVEFHLNLLKMTAMMRRTRMVMIEIVIIRFVAILYTQLVVLTSSQHRGNEGTVPTSHTPQRLYAPINIALALAQHPLRVQDRLPLGM